MVRKEEFRLKGFISLEEINLSWQKQNYRFYLFDKSWYFPAKHVIYNNMIYLRNVILAGADPGFLDRAFKCTKGGSICSFYLIIYYM